MRLFQFRVIRPSVRWRNRKWVPNSSKSPGFMEILKKLPQPPPQLVEQLKAKRRLAKRKRLTSSSALILPTQKTAAIKPHKVPPEKKVKSSGNYVVRLRLARSLQPAHWNVPIRPFHSCLVSPSPTCNYL